MRRLLQIAAIVSGLLGLFGGVAAWWAYDAINGVRPFYAQAMKVEPQQLRHASQELTSRAAAMVNDARRGTPWQATFSQDQINGWLAVDLVENHADLLPTEFVDPRIAIDGDTLSLGVRYMGGRFDSVLSADIRPRLQEPNVVALELLSARAGRLPVPLDDVATHLTTAAARLQIPLTWVQHADTPTALVQIPFPPLDDSRILLLETLQIEGGSISIGGTAIRPSEEQAKHGCPAWLAFRTRPQWKPVLTGKRAD